MKNCSHVLTFLLQIFIINCVFSQTGECVETLSLDGDWEVIFDDNDQGILNKWYTNDNFNIHPSKQTDQKDHFLSKSYREDLVIYAAPNNGPYQVLNFIILNQEKIKKKIIISFNLSVDLFLILFDVLSSPILIVMRMLRYVVGKYLMEGVKNRIKQLLYWLKAKPRWVSVVVIPVLLVIVAHLLVLMWIFGQAFGEFIMEEWGDEGDV